MTESEADEALKPLDSRVKLLAFLWKDGGEAAILYGDDLCPAEFVTADAQELRRLGFKALADLLDRIASNMPPAAILVPLERPGTIDRERERRWAYYVFMHQDDERVTAHDRRWYEARRAWERQHSTALD